MRKSEIWLINLDPTVGAEIKKTRPAIIVSEDAIGSLPLRVIVPLTDWKDHYQIAPWMVRIEPNTANGLGKPSAADAFQIRSVSQARFINRIGRISNEQLQEILKAIQIVIGA
ncbi:MAG: PemK family transcriptional regulator [Anaerolineales bacterium]|nr:MAG: PemK family transcriptional regulator [Anaerolineales bacterium]